LEQDNLSTKAQQPVNNVSWFAARAYCKSLNKRLPTTAEWEYAAAASATQANGINEAGYKQKILDWYAKPATEPLPKVKQTSVNYWGVYGMHGVVWELVNDFNTGLVTGESRGDSQLEKALFCGAGASSSVDPGDYAAFMRYALRSSYQANYTMESLGFRCAKDLITE
jgi:formylglycine-generating enzyme required for sulfatase activity